MTERLIDRLSGQPSSPLVRPALGSRLHAPVIVRTPVLYRLLALIVGVLAVITAAVLPYRLLNPPPDIVSTGGSLGRSMPVHSRTGLATVGVMSLEWVTTPSYQRFLVLDMEATGEWGSLALGGNQFAINDGTGERSGSSTPPHSITATPWRWGWIRAGERWRGSLVFQVAKQDLSLEIYDANADLAATFLIPGDAQTGVQNPHSLQIPLGSVTEAVPIRAGDSSGELWVTRTQVVGEEAPELHVRFRLAVRRGAIEPDSTWFVQSPAPSVDDGGINELHISLNYGAAPRGQVTAGDTIFIRLVLQDFPTGSMVTIVYENSDIARILLAKQA